MRSPLYHLAHPLLTFAGLLFVVGAPFVFLARSDPAPFSQIARGPAFLAGNGLTLAASFCLLLGLAGLAGHHGPGGRRMGGPAVIAGLAGALGAAYWTAINVFIAPWLGETAPAVLNGSLYTAPFLIGWLGATALYCVGMIWLGVSGFRSRVVPLPAAILLAIDGPVAFALGADFPGVLAGAGLLWAGVAGLRRPAGQDDVVEPLTRA
ncbi:hypothetical protein ACFLIM_40635 [Nonomuraea sp. M3C6]|jgi:hypothetical protein|uniref:DUF4386 family protein n=1 Tax=Nonomuraea marmarensis TaxID=3351344 RepID=A0ABW7AT03_9ACTN